MKDSPGDNDKIDSGQMDGDTKVGKDESISIEKKKDAGVCDEESKKPAIKSEDTVKSKVTTKPDVADGSMSDEPNSSVNEKETEKRGTEMEVDGKSEDNNPQNKAKPDESKSLVNDDKIKKESESMIVASNSDDDQPEKKNGDAAINTSDKPEAEKDISHTDATNEKNDTTPTPGSIESDTEKKMSSSTNNNDVSTEIDMASTSAEKKEIPKSTLSMEERSGKFAAMAKKRGLPSEEKNENKGSKKEIQAEVAVPVIYVLDSKGRRVKVIDDDAEEMDCEFLNNRQAFLNLCQGNHYQFDHLRRAKHSSMMVLWHLHNRDAPKFVQQCTTCSREILQGYRFHCPICADFDQCQDCVQNPNTPRHPHQLKPIAVAGQQTELTDAQRKERQRSIQLHMTLLQHAATCNSPKCPSANCTKMKGLLKHGAQCQIKAAGGCNVCKRIWALLQIHARQCKAQQCPVPNCMAIRERVRQLKKQQQAMDDRRRQEMNRVYRGAR